MPNEVSRLAKYVDTMKANPAVAQKESQQPVDGIAAMASQLYNAAPKPKAPVSYPEGTALMKATAGTPAAASGGLSEVFREAAKNPQLAPYIEQLVQLAKAYKSEHPEASEEELGKAVFSSAPPEIKHAILDIAYQHVGGEQGMAKGGEVNPFSDENLAPAKQSYLDKVSEERAKNRYKERISGERAKIEAARKEAPEFVKDLEEKRKEQGIKLKEQQGYEERLKSVKQRKIDESNRKLNDLGSKGSEAAKAPKPATSIAPKAESPVKPIRVNYRDTTKGIETTPAARLAPTQGGIADSVPGGSKEVLTKGEYERLPLKEKITSKVGPAAGIAGKAMPWLNRLAALAQTVPAAKAMYDSFYDNVLGSGNPSEFLRDSGKFGLDLGNLGITATTGPVLGIASNALTAAMNNWLDSFGPAPEDKAEPATPYDSTKYGGPGGTPSASGIATQAPAEAGPPKPEAKPQTKKVKAMSGIAGPAQRQMQEQQPQPAPQPSPQAAPAEQPVQQPAQPQYDESMPLKAIQKIMELSGGPVMYSQEIMDALKQQKRDAMLQTALGMLSATGAGLSQRNQTEGMAQANLLGGNALMSGLGQVNEAENQWLKALHANQTAPQLAQQQAADAYLRMQSDLAKRQAGMAEAELTGRFNLAREQIQSDAANARNAYSTGATQQHYMEQSLQNAYKARLDTAKIRLDKIDAAIDDLSQSYGPGNYDSLKQDPNYIQLQKDRVEAKRVYEEIANSGGAGLGLAGDTSMGQQYTEQPLTLTPTGDLLPQ